jgi:hypothetical protein
MVDEEGAAGMTDVVCSGEHIRARYVHCWDDKDILSRKFVTNET